MPTDWSSLFDVAASLFLFALGTQCALAWIFALLFLSFLRAAGSPRYFRAWTWSWFARALALAVILLRFTVPVVRGEDPQIVNGGAAAELTFTLYQGAKLLSIWWLLEGLLEFVGRPAGQRVRRGVPLLLLAVAFTSVLLAENVEELLLVQAPFVIAASLAGAVLLLGLPRARRAAGTRITGAALLAQASLWVLYTFAFADPHGPWPLVRTPWTILAAHNSYFDLAVDVLVASGLMVLLLQDGHRRQLEGEAERARLRAELARGERLRSLGTLVSGVAHELNSPLTSILGYAEVLCTSGDLQTARQAGVVREQALRCRHIVRGLANFGGHDSEMREPLDLRTLCERVVRGFSLEPGTARIEIDAPADLPELLANRFALEQVVANLLSNALQASPANGLVTLALRSTPDALVLSVEDEGPGIPEAIRAHVFDPFFSTRTREHGMGLGLAIVHGVVQAHDGSVRAENRVPRGARLVVTLPLRPTPAMPPAAPLAEHVLEPRPRLPMDTGRPRPLELLVIEDEPRLCELFRSLGTIRGWRVVSAGSGADGLARLSAERTRFDVILCDLRMPGPSGIEIHDRLRAEDPELLERFLFVTGDLGSDETALFARRCTRPIVRKPFEFSELGVEIETLAGARRIAEG